MALELSERDQRVIMAYELDDFDLSEGEKKVIAADEFVKNDSGTASLPLKRALGDTFRAGTEVASDLSPSPTKRGKKDVVDEQEVQDLLTQGSRFNARGEVFAKVSGFNAQGQVIANADGFNARGKIFAEAHEAGEDVVGVEDERSECGSEEESLTGREERGNAGDRTRSLYPWQGNLVTIGSPIVERECEESRRKRKSDTRLEQPDSDAASSERADEDSGASASSTLNDDTGIFSVAASVIGRQRNDPEFREKIHKVETDFWAERISRAVYNEERFKLYSKEEVKEARIMWPPRELRSPASFRDEQLELLNMPAFVDPEQFDDLLFQFGCPFHEESNEGGDEDAAKKRWMDEIECKFKDPDSKMAEYKRWERIKEVETAFYYDRIFEDEYNERRFALYTEEEREEKGIVWPDEDCYSPAGYRDYVFDQCESDDPDLQTCMEFHWPVGFRHADKADEENVCELCIPLIKEHEDTLERKKKEKQEAREKAVRQRALLEVTAQWAEKQRAKKAAGKPYRCVECNKKFASEGARSQHVDAKHKN